MPAIGIDLGTTNTCYGVYVDGAAQILKNARGVSTTPSYVAFTERGCIVGEEAKQKTTSDALFETKRFMGRRKDDASVKKAIEFLPFKVCAVDDNDNRLHFKVKIKDKVQTITPEEVAAAILGTVKSRVEHRMGFKFGENDRPRVVIAVPAHFTEPQRDATRDAARIAGLDCVRLINEPTAAALAFGVQTSIGSGKPKNVMIFDLGGGTLDVSIMRIADADYTVKATAGLAHLGGEIFNNRLMHHCIDALKEKHRGKNLELDEKAKMRLRAACEQAKIGLSTTEVQPIEVSALYKTEDFALDVTRSTFNELCEDSFDEAIECALRALQDSKLKKKEIDVIVFVGGSTRIPKIQEMLKEEFDREDLNLQMDADEAIAKGATLLAATLTGELTGTVHEIKLADVISVPIGWEDNVGKMHVVLAANTLIPCEETALFETSEDNQDSIDFKIFQGFHKDTIHNTLIGTVFIPSMKFGLPPRPAGELKFNAKFRVTADGLVVTAVDEETDEGVEITIAPSKYRLTDDALDECIARFKRIEADDKARHALEKAKNDLKEMCTKSLRAIGKLPKRKADEPTVIECHELIKKIRKWVDDADNADVIALTRRELELKAKVEAITTSGGPKHESEEN